MAIVVAIPFDEVLILVAILMAVQYLFNFIFKVIINLNRLWWRWGVTVDLITVSRGEAVNMEYRMLFHGRREK